MTVTAGPLADQIKTALEEAGLLTAYTVHVRVSARRRSSVGAAVEPGGKAVTIAAPASVQPADVVASVRRMHDRIIKGLVQAQKFAPAHPVKELVNGEGFEWLGRSARLRVIDGHGTVERVQDGHGWWMHADRAALERHGGRPIVDWYCREGTAWLEREAPAWWSRMQYGRPMPALRVADIGRKRWGVYAHGPHQVTLAWQALQVPRPMATYVLVHELAHATRPGGKPHGPEFWRVVRRALPLFERDRDDLNEYGCSVWMGDVTPR
ncbi:YgjP-like metallopeptidase domain-containing protein [Streptomyces sp. NPDC056683]|uniref:YgjP-like metallopeptidase domain-containing protein n=1 Tax=Streptomyces sp. NPDC056683 TaxID=3345910 RepID=UPI00368ACC70